MTTRHDEGGGGGDREATATVPEEVWTTPFATSEEAVRAAEDHGQEQLPESESESEEEAAPPPPRPPKAIFVYGTLRADWGPRGDR